MDEEFLILNAASVDLDAAPIPPAWVLSGAPAARNKKLMHSRDRTTALLIWECTPGRFLWHYTQDETVYVLAGEALMLRPSGEERRFAAGDVGFFPAGFTCQWRVTEHFRKAAVVRETLGRPLGLAVKAWKELLRIARRQARPPGMRT